MDFGTIHTSLWFNNLRFVIQPPKADRMRLELMIPTYMAGALTN